MNSDKIFYIVVGVITVAIFFGIIFFAGGSNQKTINSTDVDIKTLLGENTHSTIDTEKAKVVLVEFSDFQCPACKSALGEVSRIKEDFKNTVAIVYKNYPLTSIHNYAYKAALASEAAAKQGKFWEYHDILFREQREVSNPLKDEDFHSFAQELKLNEEQFKKDYQSTDIKKLVDADIKLGDTLGLKGTPTFYLNGKQYNGNDLYGDIKKLVEVK